MIESPFFTQFLKISNAYTLIAIILLVLSIGILKVLKDKRTSFSKRMIIALVIGLVLGIAIDLVGKSSPIFLDYGRREISVWYSLVGTGFLKLVQLLAIPVVFLSIIQVVVNVEGDRIKSLTGRTFATLLGTTAISAIVGILVVKLFNLQGASFAGDLTDAKAESIGTIATQSFPEFFLKLIPNNIFQVMSDNRSDVCECDSFLTSQKTKRSCPFYGPTRFIKSDSQLSLNKRYQINAIRNCCLSFKYHYLKWC